MRRAMTVQPHRIPDGPVLNGPLAADISNSIVRLVREHFGKGPTQAKTVVHEDVVVTVLRGGFTHAEKTLYNAGRADIVDAGRRAMQDVFEREMRAEVERLTGRHVEAFLSANHHDPDASVEIFLLDVERNGRGDGLPPAAA
jgi:uncharacterized protein YbcI